MLSLEDFKQGTCCSIYGLVQSQMHQLMLSKAVDQSRFEQLVLQRCVTMIAPKQLKVHSVI